ncbi:hypothetical protein M422DRAFT_243546 [Sphaerobolus stellatus SS14]|nr:hypothetical protein M422DRAFT_243546 [Sphaerobolus stellatus SS14]
MHSAPNSSTLLGSGHPITQPHTASSGSEIGMTSNQLPYVTTSTGMTALVHAGSTTSACTARAKLKQKIAPSTGDRIDMCWKKLCYTRGFLWSADEEPGTPSAALTIYAVHLPSPPDSELSNKTALVTISENPHLFKIVTPVNVTCFGSLLRPHPN